MLFKCLNFVEQAAYTVSTNLNDTIKIEYIVIHIQLVLEKCFSIAWKFLFSVKDKNTHLAYYITLKRKENKIFFHIFFKFLYR